MTERPIIFSAGMVRAILDGRKTMTRRVVKPQPTSTTNLVEWNSAESAFVPWSWHTGGSSTGGSRTGAPFRCPYGAPGDRLWVRERQRVLTVTRNLGGQTTAIGVRYEADGTETEVAYPTRLSRPPAIGNCLAYGGYRESSRITFAVESVRVERLHEITEEDARAEGIGGDSEAPGSRRVGFEALWGAINGPDSWEANPWVWVIGFSRVTP